VEIKPEKLVGWLKAKYKDIIVIFTVVTVGWVLLYRYISPPFTLLMLTRLVTDEGGFMYKPKSLADISPYLRVCAMASEDQNLPFHSGLDIEAIGKAIKVNSKGRKVFGASTISQQVAKNAFLFPQRSYVRKGLELYFTLLIETLWPKERILETYLNIAETGTLTFGAEAAAQKYFSRNAAGVSLQQAARIIAILPNPRKYNAKNPGPYVGSRQNEITELYYSLDGNNYLRELYVKADKSLYDFSKYKK